MRGYDIFEILHTIQLKKGTPFKARWEVLYPQSWAKQSTGHLCTWALHGLSFPLPFDACCLTSFALCSFPHTHTVPLSLLELYLVSVGAFWWPGRPYSTLLTLSQGQRAQPEHCSHTPLLNVSCPRDCQAGGRLEEGHSLPPPKLGSHPLCGRNGVRGRGASDEQD